MVYHYNPLDGEVGGVMLSRCPPPFLAAHFSLNSFKVNGLEGFPTVCYSLNGRSVTFHSAASTSGGEGGSS